MAKRDFPQKLTYWAVSVNGFGDYTYSLPILINGRYEEKQVLFIDKTSKEVLSKAIVYVDTDLQMEGYLAQGDKSSFSSPLDAGAHVIRQINKTPDLNGKQFLRKVFL